MKKTYVICIIVVILISITLFFRNIIGALIIPSEKINKTELDALLKSRFNPDKTVEIEANGKKYIIPLPNGAAKYKSNTYPEQYQYLVPSENRTYYINNTLSSSGWKFTDQYGAEYTLTSGKDHMSIYDMPFTRFYSRIIFRVSNWWLKLDTEIQNRYIVMKNELSYPSLIGNNYNDYKYEFDEAQSIYDQYKNKTITTQQAYDRIMNIKLTDRQNGIKN